MVPLKERGLASTKLLGGRHCLDFVNTIGGRNHTEGKASSYTIRDDRLNEYPDLLAWGMRVGLLTDREAQKLLHESTRNPSAAHTVWKRAVQLREAIYRISRAIFYDKDPQTSDLEILNRELHVAHSHKAIATEKQQFRWKWQEPNVALDRILWAVADSAAEMLTTADLTRLRQCPGEDCGWFFDDTSRNRSRQWCDMKDCGNVAKVRRFRSRVSR